MANRVAIYLRVSTQDQATELQQRELTAYVQARGWVVFKTYEDKATGTTANRAMLKAMLTDARLRRLDRIIVWKLDRFARSLKDLVTMLQELSELGIEFISLRDNIDLTTSSGRLMMHMIGAFAASGYVPGSPTPEQKGNDWGAQRQGMTAQSKHCAGKGYQSDPLHCRHTVLQGPYSGLCYPDESHIASQNHRTSLRTKLQISLNESCI